MKNRRIDRHPILGEAAPAAAITIYFEGEPLSAREGDTVATALMAHGIRFFRRTRKRGEPRGVFCGIGQCTDCIMEVDGVPNVRTCITAAADGMNVRRM